MENFIIRQCIYDDLDYVISLQEQWAKEDITYGLIPANKEYLFERLGKYFLVAEEQENIIGFVTGVINKAKNMTIFSDGELYIEIEDIYVSKNNRGQGIGNILLNKVLEISKENGIERSLLYSSTKDMESIIKFYKNHHYKTWCIQMFK
ncbi:ribosomal protein S18 acetylase RimI-like enzyme [Clostridium punense]|uniref:Ribosomal protein S18 acetylase RimI-like enzyme n=1 Tax=Clostridium punense TaxID=1054297 RepID=A0ABS4K6A5_9CLOT|nr:MULTISPECIES: GNAT family N-acetyltransferase [Clostridium]EQB86322.1 hypothetical protein M918_15400 [Clostridium sp. BL8]MBP2022681.1 ribosomal protein S18 acetylase RimI-like enzyme [Clostridium punense]